MTAPADVRNRVTTFLRTADSGHPEPLDELVPLVYDELKELAHHHLHREGPDRTLQTTGLVHEAWIKLAGSSDVGRRGRAYFFAAAARAMRQVLVDRARKRKAAKRGGAAEHAELDDVQVGVDAFAVELLDLDRALEELAERDRRHARVVECRFFGGMSVEDTADALGVSPRTVKHDWALSRAWLYARLEGRAPSSG